MTAAQRPDRDVPRPPVDPRVRERWIAARREEGRRRLRVLVAVVGLVVAAAAAYGITRTPLLAVHDVRVDGTHHLDAAALTDAAGIESGQAMVWLDTGAAERRLESLPWVRTARVRRDFPRAVSIRITERVAVAWARDGAGQLHLVDATGRVLDLVDEAPGGLPELGGLVELGPPGVEVVPPTAARVAARLGPLAARAALVSVVDGALTVVLGDGLEVRMGEPRSIRDKATAAEAVVTRLAVDHVAAHYVDVSAVLNPVVG